MLQISCFDRNDSLRISYIHKGKVKEGAKEVTKYYSKLMKADPSGNDQVMIQRMLVLDFR